MFAAHGVYAPPWPFPVMYTLVSILACEAVNFNLVCTLVY